MVTGGYRRIFGIFLQQFALHLVYNTRAEEYAHRTLRPRHEVELFPFGHGCPSFAAGQDDTLHFFGNGKL